MTIKVKQGLERKKEQEEYFKMKIYSNIAELLSYPTSDFSSQIAEIELFCKDNSINNMSEFRLIAKHFTNSDIKSLQEYYIKTFDVNAVCYLDIGYVLFGEDAKRSQFLLHMQNEQLQADNNCGKEFSDHLPNILTLLPKLKESDFKEELVVTMLVPALKHMIENFSNEENSYKYILSFLVKLLETQFVNSEFKPYKIQTKGEDCGGAYGCGMDFSKLKNKRKFN
jgi:nitrate reductase assembly molybdenum cofactor insertion protein NarJ